MGYLKFLLNVIIFKIVLCNAAHFGQESKAKKILNGSRQCPRQCTCEIAPLRAASFVATWMTSWGEDDLPNIHPNDILNVNLMINSLTANDASVDVDVVGLHATCSLHPTTNVSILLQQIPKNTMVLNILQAPGCNLTIVDGGQLVGLSELKALHLQGYAHKHRRQVSGYKPNRIAEMIEHKKLLDRELQKVEGNEELRELRLALAEDALQPLNKLQLLDLQFVRLVASREERRSRRYSSEPVSSTTLLDLPFDEFIKFVDNVNTVDLPLHLRSLLDDTLQEIKDNNIDNRDNTVDSYIVQKDVFTDGFKPPSHETIRQNLHLLPEDRKDNMIDALNDNSVLLPYEIYRDGISPKLAPFESLKELKYLRVAHARLDRVGPELLQGLHQLHTLTLEYNKIKILPDGLFSPTPGLRHLSVAHNNIFNLESESLKELEKLITLDLDFNLISVFGLASFPGLPSLLTLRAVGNPISHILPDAFRSLNATEHMFLGSPNASMDVHQNSFRFLDSLKTLELKNVTESSLQKKIFTGMINLMHLTVHGLIPEIAYDAFAYTPYLHSLNISFCSLERLSIDAFFGLNLLTRLDLSHNKLYSLSPGILDHLTSLRELFLNDNLLTTISLGLFLPVPVKLLQLHNNPWNCTCDLLQLSPSVTNKVIKTGNIKCEWTDKLATVCKKGGDKLVYDARVAPLCQEPASLRGFDVYHAALRHLECRTYHWDPSILNRYSREDEIRIESISKTTIEVKLIHKKEDNNTEPSYLPLMDFTPEPHIKDLLEIAESEGLEEVERVEKDTPSKLQKAKIQKPSKEQQMSDQPVYTSIRYGPKSTTFQFWRKPRAPPFIRGKKYPYQKKNHKGGQVFNAQKRTSKNTKGYKKDYMKAKHDYKKAKYDYLQNIEIMNVLQRKKSEALILKKKSKMQALRKRL